MKETELRIGNYLKWKSNGQEFDVTLGLMLSKHFWNHIKAGDILPIQLTEERLLKFGFEKFNKVFWRHEKYFNFILKEFYLDNKIDGYIFNYGGSVMNRVLTEAHWLQNVFILTGEELIIK